MFVICMLPFVSGSFVFHYINLKTMQITMYRIITLLVLLCGPGSSVGIATDYRLDDPGSNPGGGEIFRLSRPALGPTHPPVKRVPGLSRE